MIAVYQPKSKFLRKYIDHFTQLDFGELSTISYFVFPQYGTTIDLSQETEFELRSGCCIFRTNKQNGSQTFLTGKYTVPMQMKFENRIDEIGINFKPNGINAFFKNPFSELAPLNGQIINDKHWDNLGKIVFQTNDFIECCERLEEELEKIISNKPLEQIDRAIELFHDSVDITIAEVAKNVGWSERSLNRNFNKYIGCSPRIYKRILRFRKAIELKFANEEQLSMTALSLEMGYFDSLHFSKEFKKLTGKSPTQFFDGVVPVGAKKFPYRVI